MDGHRQLTGHQLIASVVDGNHEFVCFECVVETILRPSSSQAALCAKSLLDIAAPDPRLVEYVFGRFLQQPNLLLIDFLSRQRWSAGHLTALLVTSIDSSHSTSEAAGLGIHLVNRTLRLSPVRLLLDQRMLNSLCKVFDRGCSSTKLEVLELLRSLLRQPEVHIQQEEARLLLRLVYTQVKASTSSVSSMEILQTLILQHHHPIPLFDQEDTSLILYLIQDSVQTLFHHETFTNEETFTLFLNTILSFTLHEEYKHLLHSQTDIIAKLFYSYLHYDELVDSDETYDRLKQLCFHAIKTFALISPLSVFHYSVFTPHVLRVIMHREIRDATIADATVIISLAVEYSAAYDRELIPLCSSEIPKLLSIDDEKAVFWVKLLATIMVRRPECDIDTVIFHSFGLARKSGSEISFRKQAFIQQTVLLLPFLKHGIQPMVLRDFFNAVMQQNIEMTVQFLSSCMQAGMKHDTILQIFRGPHHCRSFHSLFLHHALESSEVEDLFSKFTPQVLKLTSRSMRFSKLVSNESSASGVILSFKRLLASNPTSDSQQLIDVHSFFIALIDVMELISPELSIPLLKANALLSPTTMEIVLSMLPDPTVVLSHDSFIRVIWNSLAAIASPRQEFSASIVTFCILTRHMDEKAVALNFLCAPSNPLDDGRNALEDYWASCTPVNTLIANLLDALLHRLERLQSISFEDFEVQCDLLIRVINFGVLRAPQKCIRGILSFVFPL